MTNFEIDRELVDVTSFQEDDPGWNYVCECGNVISNDNLPRAKFIKYEYFRDGDYCPVYSHHCRNCWRRVPDEEMRKSMRASTHKEYAVGRVRYLIDGKEVSKDEFEKKRKGE